ncbi:hypothetical protein [Jannaschia marina]|uniref:hypothetical protein n=1 Tax=Jannaschia marina TaxID=2741674 RepID=UPI0015CEB23C|nr:hypothetical protein [Jannaschia marina]
MSASPPPSDLQAAVDAAIAHALDAGLRLVVTLDGGRIPSMSDMLEELDLWGAPLLGGSLTRQQVEAGPWMIVPDLAPQRRPAPAFDPDVDPEIVAAALADDMRRALEPATRPAAASCRRPRPWRGRRRRSAWRWTA